LLIVYTISEIYNSFLPRAGFGKKIPPFLKTRLTLMINYSNRHLPNLPQLQINAEAKTKKMARGTRRTKLVTLSKFGF